MELSLPEEAVVALPGVAEPRLVVEVERQPEVEVLPLPEEAEPQLVVEVLLLPEVAVLQPEMAVVAEEVLAVA